MTRLRLGALALFAAIGVAIGVLGLSGRGGAQLDGGAAKRLVGPTAAATLTTQAAAQILAKQHLSKRSVDDEIAGRWVRLMLKDLDSSKIYFTQGDVDGFQAKSVGLAQKLRQGDLTLAYEMFKRLLERIDERHALARQLLAEPFDFSGDDEYPMNPAKANFAKDDKDVRDLWRRRLMHELLQQKADGFKDDEALAKLRKRLAASRDGFQRIDDDELVEIALSNLARAFDARSTYIGARSWRQFQDSMRSQYDGIGTALQMVEGACRVTRVLPGGAAHKDGRLKENDVIIGVATDVGTDVGAAENAKVVDVTDMRLNDIVRLLRGPRNTKVRLEVIPAGQSERLFYTLTRAPVTQQTARGAIVDVKGDVRGEAGPALRVGYLLLPSLYGVPSGSTGQPCSADVKSILSVGPQSFRERAVDLVVLDLRTNTGGILKEATAVAELFLADRPIMQVKSTDGAVQTYSGAAKTPTWDGPLVVLTSRQTASGAEIIAGALQSHGRALVVGESTHGIGTVQSLFEVGTNTKLADPKLGVMRVTYQVFYRPNGESTQKRGIVPDVELPWMINPEAGEAAADYPVDFDRIDALRYDRFNLGINDDLRAKLRKQSQDRRQSSPDFKTLTELIALTNDRAQRGTISLNLKKRLADRAAFARLPTDAVRQRKVDEAADVDRDFYFEEALAISRDYWRELKK